MDIESYLRPHRKPLLIAAEQAVDQAKDKLPDKTQLNRLISVCSEASCAEEITSYLRYQASRRTRPWPEVFAKEVIKKIETPLETLTLALPTVSDTDRDRVRVAAWRLYAVFLTRAFTYADQVRRNSRGQDHDRARR